MPKYIDADNLKTILEERRNATTNIYGFLGGAVNGCIKLLDQQPAADVEPVRHGWWIDAYPKKEQNPIFNYGICSVCGFEQSISHKLNFCPNCGAKMDAEPPKGEENVEL